MTGDERMTLTEARRVVAEALWPGYKRDLDSLAHRHGQSIPWDTLRQFSARLRYDGPDTLVGEMDGRGERTWSVGGGWSVLGKSEERDYDCWDFTGIFGEFVARHPTYGMVVGYGEDMSAVFAKTQRAADHFAQNAVFAFDAHDC